jgi:BirA family transcriptional regulator, biotin operon repressor / biotin---[acetyl-CoA-carboxylase] ligase
VVAVIPRHRMSVTAGLLATFDGVPVEQLAAEWQVPMVQAFHSVNSTMDVASNAARLGAPSSTVVVADEQSAGRGRSGARWIAPSGGIWCSVLVRPVAMRRQDVDLLGLVTLRTGLALARALDELGAGDEAGVRIKWPNDLIIGGAKVGGILTEAQWEGEQPRWFVVGVGVNRTVPAATSATPSYPVSAIPPTIARLTVLARIVDAIQAATRSSGPLSHAEIEAFDRRDTLRSHRLSSPVAGVARGVKADGSLRVLCDDGSERAIRSGSPRTVDV